jgi:hypothetical protein
VAQTNGWLLRLVQMLQQCLQTREVLGSLFFQTEHHWPRHHQQDLEQHPAEGGYENSGQNLVTIVAYLHASHSSTCIDSSATIEIISSCSCCWLIA